MAEHNAPDQEQLQVDLKILCNTVATPIRLPGLPANTTVASVKSYAHNELDHRPPVERMRLIYNGRLLSNDQAELGEVFGWEQLRQAPERVLHLAIPDHPRAPASSESSTGSQSRPPTVPPVPSPNPFRNPTPASPPPSTQTNPFRAQQPVGRSQSQTPGGIHPPQGPHIHGQALPGFPPMMHGMPGAPPGIPAELGNIINRQLQTALQEAQAQHAQLLGRQAAHYDTSSSPNPAETNGTSSTSPRPNNIFQQVIAQQQQQRAAASTGEVNADNASDAVPPSMDEPANRAAATSPQPNGEGVPARPSSNVSIQREGVGPNGARWSFSINSGGPTPGQPPHPHIHHPLRPFPSMPMIRGTGVATPPRSTIPGAPRLQLQDLNAMLDAARRGAEEIQVLVRPTPTEDSLPLSEERIMLQTQRMHYLTARAQSIVATLDEIQNRISPDMHAIRQNVASLRAAQQNVISQLEQITRSNRDRLHQTSLDARTSSATSSTLDTTASTSGTRNQGSAEVYLLSGPRGPQGLVFSNSGTFSTLPSTTPSVATGASSETPQERLARLRETIQRLQQQSSGLGTGQPQQQNQNAAQAVVVQPQQARVGQQGDQAQQLAQQGQIPNLARPAALLGHVWLAVRLLFFLYMFSGGGGWRRPLLIIGIGVAVYLARLGVFNAHVDRARRHFEGLLPLPEERRREAEMQRRTTNQNGRAPSPTEAAQRLVRQQDERIWTRLRDSVRMVERAVALFVASLWPGLGERMVATREENLRQQREREEQRQREEEEAAQEKSEIAEASEREKGPQPEGGNDGELSNSSIDKGKRKANEESDESSSSNSRTSAQADSSSASSRIASKDQKDVD